MCEAAKSLVLINCRLISTFHLPQVADLIKMDRLNRLNAVVNAVVEERAQRFANRDLEVHLSDSSCQEVRMCIIIAERQQHKMVLKACG